MVIRKEQEKLPRLLRELPLTYGPSRRYRPTKVLGKGSSAVVLQATLLGREHSGRQVALKLQKGASKKCDYEIYIQSLLHHPNIIEFYRAFLVKEDIYMVLQLCTNHSLQTLVRSRVCLTGPEVRVYTIQLAGAVQYMHSKDVMHRDLKLNNIFLDSNMDIKLGDFGLATIASLPSERNPAPCGTLNYMAPEMFELPYKGYDQRVDLWSLGVVIYTMLAGSLPFYDEDYQATRAKICNIEYGWPKSDYRWPSAQAKTLVGSLLVKTQDRFTTDQIIGHSFFTQSDFPGEMYPAPRKDYTFSVYKGTERDQALRQWYCRSAGVGRDENGENWPCVGFKECPNPIGDKREGALITMPFR